jgi:hypothetical protein
MALRDNLLPVANTLRAKAEAFGVRRYSVTVRQRTWSGGRPGLGTMTPTDLTLSPRPRVRAVSSREIAASGGTFTQGDLRIGPITPSNGAGVGYTAAQLAPDVSSANGDVMYVLVGDDGTTVARLVDRPSVDRSLGWFVVVRPTRETP